MSDPEPDTVNLAEALQVDKRSGIKKAVIGDIKKARRRYKYNWSDHDCPRAMVVELGKVARAMTYDNGDAVALYEALIRIAAVAVVSAKLLHARQVYRAIHTEMNAATFKHTWAMTPLNPQMPDGQKLVVLAEEVGEAAEATDSVAEHIQIATMAGAWAQSLRAKRPQDWVTT